MQVEREQVPPLPLPPRGYIVRLTEEEGELLSRISGCDSSIAELVYGRETHNATRARQLLGKLYFALKGAK